MERTKTCQQNHDNRMGTSPQQARAPFDSGLVGYFLYFEALQGVLREVPTDGRENNRWLVAYGAILSRVGPGRHYRPWDEDLGKGTPLEAIFNLEYLKNSRSELRELDNGANQKKGRLRRRWRFPQRRRDRRSSSRSRSKSGHRTQLVPICLWKWVLKCIFHLLDYPLSHVRADPPHCWCHCVSLVGSTASLHGLQAGLAEPRLLSIVTSQMQLMQNTGSSWRISGITTCLQHPYPRASSYEIPKQHLWSAMGEV